MYDLYINGIDSVELFSDPDLALDHFIAVFNSVSDIHAPYKNLRVKKRSNPWFSHDINSLIHQRNAAWKLARSSGSTNNWQLFRHLRNKCTYSIRRAKASYYVNSLAACGNNSSKFWKILNTIKGASPFSSTLPRQIDLSSEVLIDPTDICEAFNTHFIKTGDLFDQCNAMVPMLGSASALFQGSCQCSGNQPLWCLYIKEEARMT